MRKGVSLLEMAVVLTIVLVMMAIMLPVSMRAKNSVTGGVCMSNLQQVYKAMVLYSSDNGGAGVMTEQGDFPPDLWTLRLPHHVISCKGGVAFIPLWGRNMKPPSSSILVVDLNGSRHQGRSVGLYVDGSVKTRGAEGDPTDYRYWE